MEGLCRASSPLSIADSSPILREMAENMFPCSFGDQRLDDVSIPVVSTSQAWGSTLGSVGNGRGLGTFQRDIPALAVFARAAGQGHFEVKPSDVPRLAGGIRPNLHHVRFEEVVGGPMIPVLVLNAAVERKLVKRAHVELERWKPGPFAVVYALGIRAVRFAARLPVTLEQRRSWSENGRKSCACAIDPIPRHPATRIPAIHSRFPPNPAMRRDLLARVCARTPPIKGRGKPCIRFGLALHSVHVTAVVIAIVIAGIVAATLQAQPSARLG